MLLCVLKLQINEVRNLAQLLRGMDDIIFCDKYSSTFADRCRHDRIQETRLLYEIFASH